MLNEALQPITYTEACELFKTEGRYPFSYRNQYGAEVTVISTWRYWGRKLIPCGVLSIPVSAYCENARVMQ
jgi:hypothetical protein